MPRWLTRCLTRVHSLAARGHVRFTLKALHEMAVLDLGLDVNDALDVLIDLSGQDAAGRLTSQVTGEWMYVFRPRVAGTRIYLKLILRTECVVVSFHEEVEYGEDDKDA